MFASDYFYYIVQFPNLFVFFVVVQIQIEQLASTTNEESIILTASIQDGTLSHLGSDSAKGFLEDHEDVKSQFLGYCLKSRLTFFYSAECNFGHIMVWHLSILSSVHLSIYASVL